MMPVRGEVVFGKARLLQFGNEHGRHAVQGDAAFGPGGF